MVSENKKPGSFFGSWFKTKEEAEQAAATRNVKTNTVRPNANTQTVAVGPHTMSSFGTAGGSGGAGGGTGLYTTKNLAIVGSGAGGTSSSTMKGIMSIEKNIALLEKKCEQLLEIANKQEERIFELENKLSSLQTDEDDVDSENDLYLDTFDGKKKISSKPKNSFTKNKNESSSNISASDIKKMLDDMYGSPDPWKKSKKWEGFSSYKTFKGY